MNKPEQLTKQSAVSGFTIERTAKRMRLRFKRMLKEANVDVTIDQWVILQLLDQQNGLSQFQIASETNKDAPTVTRIIDLICQKELVERIPDTNDRRKFNIYLTTKGHQKIAQIKPIVSTFRKLGWKNIKEEDINQMMQTLNAIFYNLAE